MSSQAKGPPCKGGQVEMNAVKKHQIATYRFLDKARQKYKAAFQQNVGLPPLSPGGTIVRYGPSIYVRLPLENGAVATYRFTPRSACRIRAASTAEFNRLPKLTVAEASSTRHQSLSDRAEYLLDELMATLSALDKERRENGLGNPAIGNGAHPPLNSGRSKPHVQAHGF